MANRTVLVKLVAETSSYTAGLSKASAATMRLGEQAGATGKKSKDSFDLAGKSALVMGGLAVAGLGMAISKSMEFEKSMSAVQAATQASAGTMSDLRAAAIKAGADTAYSAKEAADGITEMAKAGVSAKDIMGGGLRGALSLAAAGQIDVADAAGIASTAMTQFGLAGKDLPHVADLLAAGAGKAMGSVDDLGQALNQSGLIASAAGLNIEETTGTLAAFASAGLIGSDAGTSLKTMLQALQAPSTKAATVMSDLGINMYDANGNMLDMAGMADQLQTHLGGLTQEQRNSALATIFGSDAVRAANVLYKEGAVGITEWTGKVNDAGYATRQAAELQDNLAGDLEKLGGSFDTLMISLGSGGQGPLRTLVQDLTGVVNAGAGLIELFSKIPGPVVAAAAAMAAFALLKGPVGSAMETIALKSMYAADSIGGAGGLRGAATNVVSAINPMMVAVAAAAVVIAGIASTMHNATSEEDKWAQAILDGSAAAAKFAEEAQAQNDKEPFAWMARLDQWTGMTASMDDARQKAQELYDAMDPLSKAQQNVTYDTNRLAEAIDKFGADSPEAAKAADFLAASNERLASRQAAVKDATDQAATALVAAQDPAAALQTSLEGVATGASDSKKQIDLYKTSLDILNGAHLTAIQAEADFYAAIAASDGALDNLTGTVLNAAGGLDVQSEAGRQTFSVLSGVKDAADQYIATLIEQGATSADANAKDAELRASFYNTALQMTGSADAASRLTDEIYGIPEQRVTTITADTGPAETAISNLVNRSWVTHIGVASDYSTPSLRAGTGLATGGYTGPGGKYEPAPYQVHRGEIVWSQADIAAHGGVSAVESARRSRPLGYADGGVVGDINTIVTAQADAASLQAAANALQGAADKLISSAPGPGGSVERWRPVVLQALAMLGQSPALANGVLSLIASESGGNPNAINLTDSNAKAGHPSRGLMQTIPTTFAANRSPSLPNNIVDPLANIYAGIHYALARYGPAMLAAGGRKNASGGYMGYADGGTTPANSPFWVGERGPELMWSSREQYVSTAAQSREFSGGSSGGSSSGSSAAAPQVTVQFFVDGEEFRGMARTEVEQKLGEVADRVIYAGG